MRVLAIDQGTTSTRAFLLQDGRLTQVLARSHRQILPAPGRVEHDGEEILADLHAALDAGQAAGGFDIAGLDNQGESCLAWDALTGAPVSPVIVWQDDRTAATCAAIAAGPDGALVSARAGLPVDPYFAGSKLGWIMAHVPAAADLARRGRLRLGTTDAFFRDRLTGRFETDPTTASRTALMNLATGDWDADLCALFGVPLTALPRIAPTAGDLGALPGGQRLTASVVDQQAALFGHGARRPGDAKITFGTGAFALALTGGVQRVAGLVPTVAWAPADAPRVHAVEGGVHAAAAAVNWARGLGLFRTWEEVSDPSVPPAIARGIAFVPALAGLAAPHWDRAARGTWMGLSLDTTPLDMARAVIEGVAFRAAEVMAAMDRAIPPAGPVSIDGGMTRNPWFCQFLADALARPVRVSAEPELTALGCAGLAMVGAGVAPPAPGAGRVLTPRPMPEGWRAAFAAARDAAQGYGTRGG